MPRDFIICLTFPVGLALGAPAGKAYPVSAR